MDCVYPIVRRNPAPSAYGDRLRKSTMIAVFFFTDDKIATRDIVDTICTNP